MSIATTAVRAFFSMSEMCENCGRSLQCMKRISFYAHASTFHNLGDTRLLMPATASLAPEPRGAQDSDFPRHRNAYCLVV